VHKRFTGWAKVGVRERVFENLLTWDRDNAYLMLDSTIVRAHRQAATGKGGVEPGSGAFQRRTDDQIHIACETLGRPLRAILSPGQADDAPKALALMEGFRPRYVLADATYDANTIRNRIADIGGQAVIPCNPRRKHPTAHDADICKHRNRIEHFFGKLKRFRRIATRYDRRDPYFPALFHIAAAITWMR